MEDGPHGLLDERLHRVLLRPDPKRDGTTAFFLSRRSQLRLGAQGRRRESHRADPPGNYTG